MNHEAPVPPPHVMVVSTLYIEVPVPGSRARVVSSWQGGGRVLFVCLRCPSVACSV